MTLHWSPPSPSRLVFFRSPTQENRFAFLFNFPAHSLSASSPEPIVSLGREAGLLQSIEYAGLPVSREEWAQHVGDEA